MDSTYLKQSLSTNFFHEPYQRWNLDGTERPSIFKSLLCEEIVQIITDPNAPLEIPTKSYNPFFTEPKPYMKVYSDLLNMHGAGVVPSRGNRKILLEEPMTLTVSDQGIVVNSDKPVPYCTPWDDAMQQATWAKYEEAQTDKDYKNWYREQLTSHGGVLGYDNINKKTVICFATNEELIQFVLFWK